MVAYCLAAAPGDGRMAGWVNNTEPVQNQLAGWWNGVEEVLLCFRYEPNRYGEKFVDAPAMGHVANSKLTKFIRAR